MKVLVTVAGRLGAVASALTEALQARDVEVDRLTPLTVQTLAGYDGVVVGSAVYLGGWLPSARSLLERHRAELAQTPFWLLSGGGPGPLGAAPGQEGARGHWVVEGPAAERLLWLGDGVVVRLVGESKATDSGSALASVVDSLADAIVAELRRAGPVQLPPTGQPLPDGALRPADRRPR